MNKINPIPPPPPSSPTGVDQLYTPPKISSTIQRKGFHSLTEITPLPFPESLTPDMDKTGNATLIQASLNDSLLEELDHILHSQAEEIEKKFKEIEEREQGKELIDAILELESWGYDILSFTNDNLPEGVNFLERVLPVLFDQFIPLTQRQEALGNFSSLLTTFLTLIDTGAQGAALICKGNILEQSKKLLIEYKSHFMDQSSQQSISSTQTEELSTKNRHFQRMIDEWELQISLEEKELADEKMQYGLNTSANLLTLLTEPLSCLPKTLLLEELHIAKSIGWVTLGIEYVGLALEVKQIRKESHTFNEWKESYQKLLALKLPQFKVTESGTHRINFIPEKKSVHLSSEDYKDILFKIIQNKNLSFIRNKFNECDIKLPSTITTKDLLIDHLRTHPALIDKYVQFQQQLEAINTIIYTSESLLAKREAIMKKKKLFLKPRFHIIKQEIHARKKELFSNQLQNIVKKLQSSCSFREIENTFIQFGFYQSPISLKNQQLLLAFTIFKHDQLHNSESVSSSQQNLINMITDWIKHPNALDTHFDKWFDLQDVDSLMHDYIDHQETIEHTIKNSLKQMIQKKHAFEEHFLNFKSKKSHMHFAIATLSLGISTTFAILGLLGTPFAGAGAILLGLSVGTATLSFGFFAAGYLHSLRYKPHTAETMSFFFQIKVTWTNLQNAVAVYSHQSKEKKLIEVAKILHQLHVSSQSIPDVDKFRNNEYQKALMKYQKAKLDLEKSQERVEQWTQKLKKIEARIKAAEWKDFSQYASLPPFGENGSSFDTLEAFQQALQACDLRLLDAETKNLLQVQLGINLEKLQNQIKTNPKEIKNFLQDFFALTDAGLVDFIKTQQGRLKKGLIKSI